MAKRRKFVEHGVRLGIFVLALVPFLLLAQDALTDGLGTNPIEQVTHRTGWWALTFLLLTLAVTPIRQLLGIGWLVRLRRMLGLYAFFYASLHFLTYIGLDQFFAFEFIVEDIVDRPYITVGFAAFLILVPLTVTSTKKMVRRLGGRRWNLLHKTVYVATGLGILHFMWLVKADMREPLIFAWILIGLLGYRLLAKRLRQPGVRAAQRRLKGPRGASNQAPRSVEASEAGTPS